MVVVKGVALKIVMMALALLLFLFFYGAMTGHSGNWVIVGILFLALLFVREMYVRLK